MPTLPQDQPPPPTRKIHEHRRMAESFGTDAQRYDSSRPSYPDELIDRVLADSPGRAILDVGTGTGIVARQLMARGCQVLGVEPDARMAEFARGTGIEVEEASFETWNTQGRTFDALVAGQCWHWVDPVAGAAKATEVVRASGLVALFGHVFQLPPAISEVVGEAFRRVAPDSPINTNPRPVRNMVEGYQDLYAKFGQALLATGKFTEPENLRYDWERTYSRAELLTLIPTFGGLAVLPPDQLAEVLADAGAAMDTMDEPFVLPYVTVAVLTTRT